MEEHPLMTFATGGSFLMILIGYTVKNLLGKIDCLKRKGHKHDIQIAVLEEKLKNK